MIGFINQRRRDVNKWTQMMKKVLVFMVCQHFWRSWKSAVIAEFSFCDVSLVLFQATPRQCMLVWPWSLSCTAGLIFFSSEGCLLVSNRLYTRPKVSPHSQLLKWHQKWTKRKYLSTAPHFNYCISAKTAYPNKKYCISLNSSEQR